MSPARRRTYYFILFIGIENRCVLQKDVQTTIQEFIFKLSYKYNYIHILAVFSEIRLLLLSIQFKAMAANFERLPPIIPIYISPTLWFYELLK